MKRQRYELTTKWLINAPVDTTWNALADPHIWKKWWPDIKQVKRLEEPGLVAIVWQNLAGYSLHIVVHIEDQKKDEYLKLIFSGDIIGRGEVRLRAKSKQVTTVNLEWNVKTTKSWMNRLARPLERFFTGVYRYTMHRGRRGLNKYLAENNRLQ